MSSSGTHIQSREATLVARGRAKVQTTAESAPAILTCQSPLCPPSLLLKLSKIRAIAWIKDRKGLRVCYDFWPCQFPKFCDDWEMPSKY